MAELRNHINSAPAEPAIVHVQTILPTTVVVHAVHLFSATFSVPVGTGGSGFFVNSSGAVITTAAVVPAERNPAYLAAKRNAVTQFFEARPELSSSRLVGLCNRSAQLGRAADDCLVVTPEQPDIFVYPYFTGYPRLSAVSLCRLGCAHGVSVLATGTRVSTPAVSLASEPKVVKEYTTLGYNPRSPVRPVPGLAAGSVRGFGVSHSGWALLDPDDHEGRVLGLSTSAGPVTSPDILDILRATGTKPGTGPVDQLLATALDHLAPTTGEPHWSEAEAALKEVQEKNPYIPLVNTLYEHAKEEASKTRGHPHGEVNPVHRSSGSSSRRTAGWLAIAGVVAVGAAVLFVLGRRRHRRRAQPALIESELLESASMSDRQPSDAARTRPGPVPPEQQRGQRSPPPSPLVDGAAAPLTTGGGAEDRGRTRLRVAPGKPGAEQQCARCGARLGADHRHCANCGQPVA